MVSNIYRLRKVKMQKLDIKPQILPFFGYKIHIAIDEELNYYCRNYYKSRKNDGKQLETLIENSIRAGIDVETIIGDVAYSEKRNTNIPIKER